MTDSLNIDCDAFDVIFIRGTPVTLRKNQLMIEFGVVDQREAHGLHLHDGKSVAEAIRNESAQLLSSMMLCSSFKLMTNRIEALALEQRADKCEWLAKFNFETVTIFFVIVFATVGIILAFVLCRSGRCSLKVSP